MLSTFRDGLASQAGHDLTIDATRWHGELVADDDGTPQALVVRVDMGSLIVREGVGGLKPLTERDRREIGLIMRDLFGVDDHPEAEFAATAFEAGAGEGTVKGTLTVRGVARPLALRVTEEGPGAFRASGSVSQSAFGIRPYTAFFGALKVRDAVEIQVRATVPTSADAHTVTR